MTGPRFQWMVTAVAAVAVLLGVAWMLARTPATPIVSDVPMRSVALAATEPPVATPTRAEVVADEPIERQVAAALRRHCGIAGRVVDERGAPLAAVSVELELRIGPIASGDPELRTLTGRDGRFEFDGVATNADLTLWLDPGGERHTEIPLGSAFAPDVTADLGSLVAPVRGTVVGRIVGADGTPIPDATVEASAAPPNILARSLEPSQRGIGVAFASSNRRSPNKIRVTRYSWTNARNRHVRTATTDAGGRFRMVGIATASLVVSASARGYAPGTVGSCIVEPNRIVDIGDGVLQRGSRLEGTVFDYDGRPVAGANVCVGVGDIAAEWMVVLQHETTTGARGEFAFADLAATAHVVAAFHPESSAIASIACVVPGQEPARLRFADTTTLVVTARTAAREVVPHPIVAVSGDWGRFLASANDGARATTRADGAVECREIPAGDATVSVWKSGYLIASVETELRTPIHEVGFELQEAPTIQVSVVDDQTGASIEGAFAACTARGFPDLLFDARSVARTDANGRAALCRVATGAAKVGAMARGFAPADLEVDEAKDRVTVRLSRFGSLTGRVLDRGEPPKIECVAVLADPDETWRRSAATACVDTTGSFRFGCVAPGRYRCVVRPLVDGRMAGNDGTDVLGSAQVTIASGAEQQVEIDIASGTLEDGVRGTLRLNGHPTSATLVLDCSKSLGRQRLTTHADSAGAFAFKRVPLGSAQLSVKPDETWPPDSCAQIPAAAMTVTEGLPCVLDVDLSVGDVAGFVVDEFKNPIAGANVRIGKVVVFDSGEEPRTSTQTDARGAYHIANVPVGPRIVTVSAPGFVDASENVRFERAVTALADFTLTRAVSVRGRIDVGGPVDPDFTVVVDLRPLDGKSPAPSGMSADRATGAFEFHGLRPGRYSVSAWWNRNAERRERKPNEPAYVSFSQNPTNELMTQTIDVPESGILDLVLSPNLQQK